MDGDTAVVVLGLGIFASLALIVFFFSRPRNSYVSFSRDSEGRIIEIAEMVR